MMFAPGIFTHGIFESSLKIYFALNHASEATIHNFPAELTLMNKVITKFISHCINNHVASSLYFLYSVLMNVLIVNMLIILYLYGFILITKVLN